MTWVVDNYSIKHVCEAFLLKDKTIKWVMLSEVT